MLFFEYALLGAFAVTIVSELCVALIFFSNRPDVSRAFLIAAVIVANAFTHPLFVAFAYHIYEVPYVVVEIAVFCVEAIMYRILLGCSWGTVVCFSVIANSISICIGYMVRVLL